MVQARRMWNLWTKIDVWSKGLEDQIRETARDLLTKAYLQLSPRRVWLYTLYTTMAVVQQATLPKEGDPSLEPPGDLWNESPVHTMVKGEKYFQR